MICCAGSPAELVVKEGKDVEIENGNPVIFNVEIHDFAGNVTNDGKLICTCKVSQKHHVWQETRVYI